MASDTSGPSRAGQAEGDYHECWKTGRGSSVAPWVSQQMCRGTYLVSGTEVTSQGALVGGLEP